MATASKAALRAGHQAGGKLVSTRLTSQVDATFHDTATGEKLSLWALKIESPLLPYPMPPNQLYLRFPRCSQR